MEMLTVEIALGIVLGALILIYLSQIVRWTALSVVLLLSLGIILSVFIDSVDVPEFQKAPVSSTLAYLSLGMSVFAFVGLARESYKDDRKRLANQRQKDEKKRMREMAKASGSDTVEERWFRLAKRSGTSLPLVHDDDFRG
jgi:hypothetical protein